MLRCIFCAMCVEACPTEAITMTHLFEMSTTTRDDAIYTRAELLVEPDGTPNHPEEANRLIDLDELKLGDGWMRATASGGRAAFEGVVGWTPSATRGELPAEVGQSDRSPLLRGSADGDAGGTGVAESAEKSSSASSEEGAE